MNAEGFPSSTKRPGVLIRALRSLRGTFAADAEARKYVLLCALVAARIRGARDLLRCHDELLFAAAFPDSARIHEIAEGALEKFAARAHRLRAAARRKLRDSGVAGSVSVSTYLYGAAHWLVKHQERVRIDWLATGLPEGLGPLLRLSLSRVEADAFEAGNLSTPQWIELASGLPRARALPWLLHAAPERAATERSRHWRDLYDAAEITIEWEIGSSPRSVSRNRAPRKSPALRRAMRKAPVDVVGHITRPLAGIRRLRGPAAAEWHDACVAALVARGREVSPTLYANRGEIYLVPLGEGVELCVLGVASEDRLALESNYGFVMFASGVPIGYGGVTPLAAQANTGINIFESFRRSEAAFLFSQALRAFHALFGCVRFIVNPYQIGANNDEAIESGAYWFYHRLGFRPRETEVEALASAEYARMAKERNRRTPSAMLQRLARADLILELSVARQTVLFEERWLLAVSRAVAQTMKRYSASARQAHLEELSGELCGRLTGRSRPLRGDERAGAACLAPVIALVLGDVMRWPVADRAALWELVRLKGCARERPFVLASRAHQRWWRTLARFCERTDPQYRSKARASEQ